MKTNNFFFFLFLLIGACKDLDKPIEPENKPIADFTILNTDFTAPVDVTIQNTSKDISDNTTYEWDLGNGQISTDKNPPIGKYLLMGTYKIKLTVREDNSSNTKEIPISVTDPKLPVKACFNFTASNAGAAPSTVTFDASCSENAKIINWDFGDPTSGSNTAVGITTAHTYTKVGTYKVKATVINGSDVKDIEKDVVILNPVPKVCLTYAADNNATMPSKVSFDASCSLNASSYAWNFGDSTSGTQNTATGAKATHTYLTNGDFKVTLTATGLGGSKDSSFIVKIKGPTVVAFFTTANNNCVGPCTVTFTNTSQNATSYLWQFGDGKTSNSTNSTVTNTYNNAGIYNVTLTATGPGGTNTATQSITIGTGNAKKNIDLSSVSINPLHGVQRSSDGKYHILYSTSSSGGTIYSAVVDKEFKAGTSASIVTGLPIGHTVAQSDGSIYMATNSSDSKFGKLLKINSSQSLSFDKTVDFNNGVANTTSYFYKPALLANDEIGVGGFYINANFTTNIGSAIATYSKSGTELLKKTSPVDGALNIGINQVAQTSGGNLIGIANIGFCWGCTQNYYVVILGSGGSFSSKVSLGTTQFTHILRITGTNNFLLYNENGKNIRGINATGGTVWSDVNVNATFIKKAISLSDGSLILCGSKGNAAYLAKYTSAGKFVWEKTFSEKTINSITYGVSVEKTADDGFLLTGGYYISGVNETDLYLVKTDKDGNIQ